MVLNGPPLKTRLFLKAGFFRFRPQFGVSIRPLKQLNPAQPFMVNHDEPFMVNHDEPFMVNHDEPEPKYRVRARQT
jgi:hypothetical protein